MIRLGRATPHPLPPPPPEPKYGQLPVRVLKKHIVSKISMNRVTLIVADTGSGKSSQVPQMLLEEGLEPIICTQPRRLAVVSISKMVAESQGCEIGQEVGYQIGQLKVANERTKITFKTAGVLLEELRGEGVAALSRYKVVILDEVHERSVESDLLLTCLKQYILRKSTLRLVLMSATADINRYKDYFNDLGRMERVEVIAVPSSASQGTLYQCRERYLEDVFKILDKDYQNISNDSINETFHATKMGVEVHNLIVELVRHIHESDDDQSNAILIFLPTYVSLEQQWLLLKQSGMRLRVHVLHSSIDVEQSVQAMEAQYDCRKVILATNIAESSVTIPGVSYVIDSCRSLEIYWDQIRKRDLSQIVWVSKSQAEQRKGRTGRTCDGQVFRLVALSFYKNFDKYETPAMCKLSLRKQVLMISCAESKVMNDPRVLFQRAPDPPFTEIIDDALEMLVLIDAIKPSNHRRKYEPTFYGRLLGSLPLSLEASLLVVKCGLKGLLREGAFLASLMDMRPMPIKQPFGQKLLFKSYLENYYDNTNGIISLEEYESTLISNFCAIQFWQRIFKYKRRLHRLEHVSGKEHFTDSVIKQLEEEWSSFHHLVPSSMHLVAETYEAVMSKIHHFRPSFLHVSKNPPLYYNDYEYKHICTLSRREFESVINFTVDTENHAPDEYPDCCIQSPYVKGSSFNTVTVASVLSSAMKQIRSECSQLNSHSQGTFGCYNLPTGQPPCKFFAKGMCKRGDNCLFSHITNPEKCKYILSLKGCPYGDACWFSHDLGPFKDPETPETIEFEDHRCSTESLARLLPCNGENDNYVLVFGESDFCFTMKLCSLCDPTKIITSTIESELDTRHTDKITDKNINAILNMGAMIKWGIQPSCFIKSNSIPWKKVQCILWTVVIHKDEDARVKELVKCFFEFLAVKLLADELSTVRVILTMHNKKYAHLQVERIGRDCFFFLSTSAAFDNSYFGTYPMKETKETPHSKPVSYVFELQPPTDILFGDYCSTLKKNIQRDF